MSLPTSPSASDQALQRVHAAEDEVDAQYRAWYTVYNIYVQTIERCRPVPNSPVTSRHSGSGEGDAGAHVEFVAAVGVHMCPDQRRERVAVGDQEQRPVARARPRGGEQPAEFVEGEKLDRVGGRAGRGSVSLGPAGTARNNRSGQFRPTATPAASASHAAEASTFFTVTSSCSQTAHRAGLTRREMAAGDTSVGNEHPRRGAGPASPAGPD